MRDHQPLPAAGRTRPSHPIPARDAGTARGSRPFVPAATPALDASALLHLQRTAGNAGVVQMLGADEEATASSVHDVVGSGGGSPLDASTRSTMESALGASFDHVRVHTDERASRSAESVGADAYTVGSDVVFRAGQYNPGTATGQRTIAHELAHVVQQSAGPVDGTAASGGIKVSNPSDRFEQAAEHTADQVMASVQASGRQAAAPAGSLQREALPEEEGPIQPSLQLQVEDEALPEEEEMPLQSSLQRQDMPEEEDPGL